MAIYIYIMHFINNIIQLYLYIAENLQNQRLHPSSRDGVTRSELLITAWKELEDGERRS